MKTLLLSSCVVVVAATASNLTGNTPTCGIANAIRDGEVVQLSDGKYNRCMSVITPKSASGRIPILFWFHGSGGNAARCGGQSELYELAEKHGFALVCGEALQNVLGG